MIISTRRRWLDLSVSHQLIILWFAFQPWVSLRISIQRISEKPLDDIRANGLIVADTSQLESASLGMIGGIIGASLGVLVVVVVSAYQVWTPVLDPYVPFLAPLAGSTIGLLSGLYPAIRASRLEPVDALRSGT